MLPVVALYNSFRNSVIVPSHVSGTWVFEWHHKYSNVDKMSASVHGSFMGNFWNNSLSDKLVFASHLVLENITSNLYIPFMHDLVEIHISLTTSWLAVLRTLAGVWSAESHSSRSRRPNPPGYTLRQNSVKATSTYKMKSPCMHV